MKSYELAHFSPVLQYQKDNYVEKINVMEYLTEDWQVLLPETKKELFFVRNDINPFTIKIESQLNKIVFQIQVDENVHEETFTMDENMIVHKIQPLTIESQKDFTYFFHVYKEEDKFYYKLNVVTDNYFA
jgi:hypothetical protein